MCWHVWVMPTGCCWRAHGPDEGPESREAYEARLGPPRPLTGEEILLELQDSGLQGRGGGSFPLWRKLQVALDVGRRAPA